MHGNGHHTRTHSSGNLHLQSDTGSALPNAHGADLAAEEAEMDARFGSVSECLGQIATLARDQHGCRFLQRKFDEDGLDAVTICFDEILEEVVDLMMDPFGNYLVQKLLECCSDDQRVAVLTAVAKSDADDTDADKSYSRDLFLFLFFALAAYGWCISLQKSKTTGPLNREQTEEWKGWMQVLFLLYHYFKASEAYNAIRLFIAAYVWMTGFGNFSYYYVRKDFSAPRFWQMMWRLNFFVFFTCITMRNDYTLYYICPMHTLFTLFVYFSLLVYKEGNDRTSVLLVKCLGCVVSVYVLWEVPGVFGVVFYPFRWLLKYTDPTKPEVDPMHEWFFRSGLDRYIWIYGMICAFCHPKYEAFLKWVDKKPANTRVSIQTVICVTTCAVLWWYHQTFFILPKLEYNKTHPYTSWIPITCFVILRNLTQTLRNFYVQLFCVCGKITLETYVSQFHVWLSTSNVPNGQPTHLMSLVPNYPLLNFGICTAAYVGISHRVFYLTNELKNACVPNDVKKIQAHFVLGVAIALAATVVGFLVVHVVMAEPLL